ncbi:ATP-dependent 6-phosphofructokinase [Quillaja saponaria]|uniref:ATP-dependent 6-phosphofructokinase n=1 Tax=Quillaja saponaria TaxID=32244 RepID=A0AAD7PTP0_QUISA|nr:ATP-dependent 6-phosphofructokinase [Quillaja saponaria]
MAVSSEEATDLTHNNNKNTFLFEPISLKELPHLTDYLMDLQTRPNPLDKNRYFHPSEEFYLTRSDVVLRQINYDFSSSSPRFAYHRAGPRKDIYFDASSVRAAIVTCGGLCPGLNTSGYRGFYSREPLQLNPKLVDGWHKRGGTALETSRGGFDLTKIVDAIQDRGFNQVYIVGGDGTLRGAVKIFDEIRRRKLNVAIVGIPKTVDNDVGIIDRSFGFQTAVEMAQQAISAAHVEAESAVNGIGLVKLMGRSTGHIALHATLSSRDQLKENGHAVLVVAEGAGQEIIPRSDAQKEERDESGNLVFLDVGGWLKSELKKWWERYHPDELFTVKYIDPTYMIRAISANATDNSYCTLLAHSAIHGIMAGYTGFVAGPINGIYAYIPLDEVAQAKNEVNTRDHRWAWVRSVTNQPDFIRS